jgi:hypothetical protein
MANANCSREWILCQSRIKIDKLTNSTTKVKGRTIMRDNTRTVISAIFKPFQGIKQKGTACLRSNRSNNSAHRHTSLDLCQGINMPIIITILLIKTFYGKGKASHSSNNSFSIFGIYLLKYGTVTCNYLEFSVFGFIRMSWI